MKMDHFNSMALKFLSAYPEIDMMNLGLNALKHCTENAIELASHTY